MLKTGIINRKIKTVRLTDSAMDDAPNGKYIENMRSAINLLNDQVERSTDPQLRLKLLESSDIELQEITVQVPDPWIPATYLNSWSDISGKTKYMKHYDGSVEIVLNIRGGAAATVMNMPTGYIPFTNVTTGAWNQITSAGSFMRIDSSGVVTVANTDEHHSHIRYMPTDATPIPLSCYPKYIKTNLNPCGVICLDIADDQDTQPLPERSGQVIWEMSSVNGEKNVKVTNIIGLPYNRKYKVKLLIIGG